MQARDSIVVEPSGKASASDYGNTPEGDIVSWVMGQVLANRKHRDTAFKDRFDEYYRIWRGKWSPESKTRKSERSRLIAPATQMAVDLTIAELVEAIFGREQFFDISDDLADQEKQDALVARDRMLEDLYRDGIIRNLIEMLVNGALYGQLIAKIVVDVKRMPQMVRVPSLDGSPPRSAAGFVERAVVYPVPIEPGQLVWDMSGPTTIDAMVGVAHEYPMPLHKVQERQASGVYRAGAVVGSNMLAEDSTRDRAVFGENPQDGNQQRALITEWHGLVPKRYLTAHRGGDALSRALSRTIPADEMIEAIVTIANEGTLLRAIPNPSIMDDRAIVAEQFDTVPNRFMGRGIVEKAYNSQKGLDTELRARADALAWVNNPMMAVDLTRLPPRMDPNIWPGKLFGTRGNPKEILTEFRFGDVAQSTFQQTSEYQNMVAQATGSQDPGQMRQGVRDESFGAAGIAVSGMIKRNRRTMFHIESFLNTLLRRVMWRKMQFDPERYPTDYEFTVRGAVGIMAREVESQQLVQMMQYTTDMPQVHGTIVKALFDQSASPRKNELIAAVEAQLKPDPEQQQKAQQMEQLQMQLAMAQLRKTQAEAAEIAAKAGVAGAKEMLTRIQAQVEQDSMILERMARMIDLEQVQVQQAQVRQQDRALQQQDRALDIQDKKIAVDARKASTRGG